MPSRPVAFETMSPKPNTLSYLCAEVRSGRGHVGLRDFNCGYCWEWGKAIGHKGKDRKKRCDFHFATNEGKMGRYEGISVREYKDSFKYLQSVYGDMVLPSTQIIPSNTRSFDQKISPFHCENKNNSLYVCPLVLLC